MPSCIVDDAMGDDEARIVNSKCYPPAILSLSTRCFLRFDNGEK